MRTFSQLVEGFKNVMPEDIEMKKKYAEQVWKILVDSYKHLDGGLLGGNTFELFQKNYADDEEIKMWKLFVRNGHVTAARVYKGHLGGRKSICGGSDGTEQGKKDLFKIMDDDYNIKDRNTWVEVSSKAFTTALKHGALIYPNILADTILQKEKGTCKPCEDGFFYQRDIKGSIHTKCIVGNPPNMEKEGVAVSKEDYERFKKLAIKYEKQDKENNVEPMDGDTKDM